MKPGTRITIHINDLPVVTEIDGGAVQRLPSDPHLIALVDAGILDLNTLAYAVNAERVSQDSARWVYQRIGLSVCGYQDVFPNDAIVNPLWDPAQ